MVHDFALSSFVLVLVLVLEGRPKIEDEGRVRGRGGGKRQRLSNGSQDLANFFDEIYDVAQVSNLLRRRLLAGRAIPKSQLCGLEIRDTADWKSALQIIAAARRLRKLRGP